MNEQKKPGSAPVLRNSAGAAFVYFDEAPTCGQLSGVIAVELSANVVNPTPTGGTTMEKIVTAHLRGSPNAMRSLVNAIESALKLLEQQPPIKLQS